MKRIRLVDFQALNSFKKELGSILCRMLQKRQAAGIHVLENVGCWLDRTGLPQIPTPHRRTLSCWMYYYKAFDKDLCKTLGDPKVCVPTSFDGDASLSIRWL